MFRLRYLLRSASIAFALSMFGPALGQTGTVSQLSAEAAKAVTSRMDENPQLRDVFAACPADKFRRAVADPALRLTVATTSTERCTADPAGCYHQCISGSGSACFHLARSFQEHEGAVPPRYTQMLFSMSCGFGYGAGCTNRASSIRNYLREGDPFRGAGESVKGACQFRSFRIACRQDDAWGCAMLGQSYQYGEGVTRSARLARSAFRKSCRLAPNFEACDFSKEGIGELAATRHTRN
jgi:hypothetical protein